MVLSVENIFTVKSEDDGQYCFLSGFAFTRDKSNEKPGVMCYLLQTVQFVIVPLLRGTRLEGVSVMPYYFVQGEGKDKEAVVLSSHMLVAPERLSLHSRMTLHAGCAKGEMCFGQRLTRK